MASVVRERFLPLENASSDFIATINSRKILAEQYIKISGRVTLRTKSHLTNTSESDGDYYEKPARPKILVQAINASCSNQLPPELADNNRNNK